MVNALAALLLSLGASAARIAPRSAFEAKLLSSDIVYSPQAMQGARLALIERPRAHAAGISVPAGVAAVYGQGKGPEGADGAGGNSELNDDKKDNDDRSRGEDRNDREQAINDGNNGNVDNAPRPPIDNELVLNNEFSQNLDHWTADNAFVTDKFGSIRASALSADGRFAAVHTGYGDLNDRGSIEQAVTVPMARNATFSLLYNFVTTEYPTWVGSWYNDYFQVVLTGPSGERTFGMAQFLNSTPFSLVTGLPGDVLEGWNYQNGSPVGGQTGWQVRNAGGLALKSGIYKLRIEVRDVGDRIVDSAVLVDRVSLK